MKILYAIQGTGNGHLSRAMEIVPQLQKMGDTDVLISGIQGDLTLPFHVKYQFYGVGFMFGKNGGVDFLKTITKLRLVRFLKDMIKLPVNGYDLVLSDFEPVSAWACLFRGKNCTGISHQNAVLHQNAWQPEKTDWAGKIILKYYAPSKYKFGFHFKALDEHIFTPVIRSAIRKAKPSSKGHYTVYLPSFSDKRISKFLSAFPEVRWEVFSKECLEVYQAGNITFYPVSLERFNRSFINCEGIFCNAGFETPAEALYMGKKLCVIPMKNQYEQACNAAFLEQMGILVLSDLDNSNQVRFKYWLKIFERLQINYPDNTKEILERIILEASSAKRSGGCCIRGNR